MSWRANIYTAKSARRERETGVRQLVHRVCRTISDWGISRRLFRPKADGERFYRDLVCLCLHQYAAFNSPVWFNVGLYHQYGVKGAMCNWAWDAEKQENRQPENPYEYPQGSACFIQSVRDNMEDIMELARSEAMLFKFGSGTGTDISTLHRTGKSFPAAVGRRDRVVHAGLRPDSRRGEKRGQNAAHGQDAIHQGLASGRDAIHRMQVPRGKKVRLLIEEGYDPQEAYDWVLFQNASCRCA